MSYYQFKNDDGDSYGSFEVFYAHGYDDLINNTYEQTGWYWHACWPGCLPDGEPNGPFDTEQEAIEAGQQFK